MRKPEACDVLMGLAIVLAYVVLFLMVSPTCAKADVPWKVKQHLGLTAETAEALDCVLKRERETFLVEGYRSQQRQEELYAQGRTTPGPRVTWTKFSWHTVGLAVDLAFIADDPWNLDHPWERLRATACACGFDAPAFDMGDLGHFVLRAE